MCAWCGGAPSAAPVGIAHIVKHYEWRRVVETNHLLTWQEHQVASMARDGYSNQDIGSRLFISPKTVEYHLHKAFNKFAITSRYQLEQVLPRD